MDRLEEVMIELAQSQKRLHEELLEFKEEMGIQREEDRKKFEEFKEEMNKKWGWLINKLGTLVEDLFYTSFEIAIKKHFGIELEEKILRRYRKKNGRSMEVDVIGVGDGKVFVLETPDKIEYIESFVEKLGKFFDFFPEYRGMELVKLEHEGGNRQKVE